LLSARHTRHHSLSKSPSAIDHNINSVYVRSEISAQPASLGTPKTLRSNSRTTALAISAAFGPSCLLRVGEVSDDLTLSPGRDRAIAVERHQDTIVPKILTPRFELLRLAKRLAEPSQGTPEAVRIEIRDTGSVECLTKDRTYRRCAAPVLTFQAGRLKLPSRV
jgi:hypothetical protein